jgi:hypothetical protein
VHYLAGKNILIDWERSNGLARLEISKIYAYCRGSMRRKTTSLTVLPVLQNFMNIDGTTLILFFLSPPLVVGPQT